MKVKINQLSKCSISTCLSLLLYFAVLFGVNVYAEELGDEKVALNAQSTAAMEELLDTISELNKTLLNPGNGVHSKDQIAEGQYAISHILATGLHLWLDSDPERPILKPYVNPWRKVFGDNPDALYYQAAIRDDRRYKISGNLGAAVFTSFTVEGGASEGHFAKSSVSALSDTDMEVAPDGSYEIIVSRKRPKSGNWLPLKSGAGQISTRHYHESKASVAGIPNYQMDVRIEALDTPALKKYGGDTEVATRIRYVKNYVSEHATAALKAPTAQVIASFPWYSRNANVFTTPGQWGVSTDDQAYGNSHAWYGAAPFKLASDEAMIIEIEIPNSRFFNIVLWNRFMQTFDYVNRTISLNRKQIQFDDGVAKIILAAKDPGLPNWLDTEGRSDGVIYLRYIEPLATPKVPKAKIVKISSLRK